MGQCQYQCCIKGGQEAAVEGIVDDGSPQRNSIISSLSRTRFSTMSSMSGSSRMSYQQRRQAKEARRSQVCSGNVRLGALISQSRHFPDEYTLGAVLQEADGRAVMVALPKGVDDVSAGNVAVKTLEKIGLTKPQVAAVRREVDIYLRMDHSNIARLMQVFDESDVLYMVMEYCDGGTLADRLKEVGKFTEKDAGIAFYQVLCAVRYCHNRPSGKVIHRDLKLANFVYKGRGAESVLKLVDFGLSRVVDPMGGIVKGKFAAGTLEYMAPEVIKGLQHDEACDLWSAGVIAYLLLSGQLPFDGTQDEESNDAIQRSIMNGDVRMTDSVWSGVSESAKDFIKELMTVTASRRPSAERALLRPWMVWATVQAKEAWAETPVSMDILKRVAQFAHENAIQRAVAAIAVYSQIGLKEEDIQLAEKQFCHFDTNGDGVISRQELVTTLERELGLSPEKGSHVFDMLDVDGDEEISRSEFMAAAIADAFSSKTVRRVFNRFDLNEDGKIELSELMAIMGDSFCGQRTKDIFSSLDVNGDREIDFEEFEAMVAGPADTTKSV